MKRKFEYYVLGGEGIGMRFVLLIACFFALLFSIGGYMATIKPFNAIETIFSKVPQVTILDGKIISPVYASKKFGTFFGDVEFNTAVIFVNPENLMTSSLVYLTQTQIFVRNPNEKYVPSHIAKYGVPVNTPSGVYYEIKVNQFKDQVFSPSGAFEKIKNILGLVFIAIGVLIFFVLIADFLFTYIIALLIGLLLRLKLTVAQLGRLLVVPWTILIIGSFAMTATKTSFVFWWLSIAIRLLTPSISVGHSQENLFVFLMPMWWIILVFVFIIFIIYIVWASGLSLYIERRDELFNKKK